MLRDEVSRREKDFCHAGPDPESSCRKNREFPGNSLRLIIVETLLEALKAGDDLSSEVFTRGDANSDRTIDVSDAARILGHICLGETIGCEDSADADGDRKIDLFDAVRLLGFLFLGSPAELESFALCPIE